MNSGLPGARAASPKMGRPGPLGAVLVAGLVAVAALGCRAEGGSAVEQGFVGRDSAGSLVVENRGAGLWAPGDGWRLSDLPLLEIGSAGEDSGTALFRVSDAVRLSDGRIVIANGGTSELLYFSPDGKLLARGGGAGGGPGEFASLMGLGMSIIAVTRTLGDTIRADDKAGGKILVFSPTGDFVRSAPLSEGPTGERVHFASGVGWLDDGTFLATTTMSYGDDPDAQPSPEGRLVRPRVALRRFTLDGTLADTIGTFPGNESYRSIQSSLDKTGSGTMQIRNAPVPFARTFHAVTGGKTVAVGVTDWMEVRVYGPDGALLRIVRGPGTPRTVDAAQREAWINANGGREPATPFPETMPAFGDLTPDAEGSFWVEAYQAPGDPPGPSRWSVYDALGRYLGDVTMPERFQPMEIGADYVLGLWKDDLDVEQVRLYGLRKEV